MGGRTELGDEGEVEAELLAEPVDGAAASLGENLGRGRARGAGEGGVRASAGGISRESRSRGEKNIVATTVRGRGRGGRTLARGTVCSGGVVCPTPAAPLMMSASNLSAESWMPLAACVRVSAPLIPEVAFVLLPPRKGHLSKRSTRPPCSSTVCAAERPARPPPMTMICSLILMRAWKPAGRSGA